MATKQLDLISGSSRTKGAGRRGSGSGGGSGRGSGGGFGDDAAEPLDTPLAEEARRRYLNYAVSVITSRALPDVRDGLKPVQRRILYSMFHNLKLYPDGRYRKCAAIVGDVIGKYHPHGDTAAYDALVRMAQDFSMRYTLVAGHGNFGSLDGDAAAAMRYTEARLAGLSMDLMEELRQGTVDFRPNYDGSTEEPVVLPARLPQLLANGCAGIAVGMATNIPPHNISELVAALVALIKDPQLETRDLVAHIKGPDFPTGGLITNSRAELRQMYEKGQGAVKVRGQWKTESIKKGSKSTTTIVVTSIPYMVNKASLIEKIADVIIRKKLPMLVDVRDESTEDVRIVLELKPGGDPDLVMAYLFKQTPLETSFHVNMTCLVPTENPDVAAPMRLDLKAVLAEFLDFRESVVKRRFAFELAALEKRIHILEGFKIVFDLLDAAIKIIRGSDGKADAAAKLMKRFPLDAEQTDAILELKLYRLAKLEINLILKELREKRARAREIKAILADQKKLWAVIRSELRALAERYAEPRRTRIGGAKAKDVHFDAEAFIVDEEVTVVITRDGWLKRVREIKDLSTTRVREGDAVLAVVRGSTRDPLTIFSNQGSAYVLRVHDVPQTTGYGEPVQKMFKFKDGERVIGALNMSSSAVGKGQLALAISRGGFGLRFTLESHREISTRTGRRFAKLAEGDEILGVVPVAKTDVVAVITAASHMLMCRVSEISELAGPGRGVTVIKVDKSDEIVGFGVGSPRDRRLMVAETENGKGLPIGPGNYDVTSRGGKGRKLKARTKIERVLPPDLQA